MSRALETGRPRLNHKDHSKTPWPPPIHPDRPNASHSRLGGSTDLQAARAAGVAAFREKLVFGNAHEAAAEAARLEAVRKETAAKAKPEPKRSRSADSGSMASTSPFKGFSH